MVAEVVRGRNNVVERIGKDVEAALCSLPIRDRFPTRLYALKRYKTQNSERIAHRLYRCLYERSPEGFHLLIGLTDDRWRVFVEVAEMCS